MTLIRITSDNWSDELVTPGLYKEITMSMSSGDFGSHTKVELDLNAINKLSPTEIVYDLVGDLDDDGNPLIIENTVNDYLDMYFRYHAILKVFHGEKCFSSKSKAKLSIVRGAS